METDRQNSPRCRQQLVYSYVIKVADTKYKLYLHHKCLVWKIFVFYHFLENPLGRPGHRGTVYVCQKCFEGIEGY